jgi:hypothetical protein
MVTLHGFGANHAKRTKFIFYKMNRTDKDDLITAWLFKIACIFWLTVKLVGWRMWTTYRLFPTAPVFENLDRIPPVVHTTLFILSFLLVSLLFFTKNKFVLAGTLAIEICMCLLDQNRWQPYEYQCLFIIFIFMINTNNQRLIITSFTFILVSTYCYSGLSKLNGSFLQTVWSPIILKSFFRVSLSTSREHYLYYSGCFLSLFELIAGVSLLFSKTQKVAAKALILMHLFILLLLGPLGLNYNIIVWPWNIAMIMYLYITFLKRDAGTFILKSVFKGWNKLVFITWGILPALHFIGYWDGFLSASMYSGKSPKMIICIQDVSKCKQLQVFCKNYGNKFCDGKKNIELQDWAINETNVIPNPEIRVYKILQKKLEKQYPSAGLQFRIY